MYLSKHRRPVYSCFARSPLESRARNQLLTVYRTSPDVSVIYGPPRYHCNHRTVNLQRNSLCTAKKERKLVIKRNDLPVSNRSYTFMVYVCCRLNVALFFFDCFLFIWRARVRVGKVKTRKKNVVPSEQRLKYLVYERKQCIIQNGDIEWWGPRVFCLVTRRNVAWRFPT